MRLVLLGILIVALTVDARAEVVQGVADFRDGEFNFSEQLSVGTLEGDIVLIYVFFPVELGWTFYATEPGKLYVTGAPIDSVLEAPDDDLLYEQFIAADPFFTYVTRCRDGIYAKFKLTEPLGGPSHDFEYYVQLDGSRVLDPTVSIKSTSWGRVKGLFIDP